MWRRLAEDALRPCFYRPWLFPRDPELLGKARPVLELYHGRWQGKRLRSGDVVLSAELTRLQALSRSHPTVPPAPGQSERYEFEYGREGTLCYLAFLDVRTGRVYGETAPQTGIVPLEAALGRCLRQERYRDAQRVFSDRRQRVCPSPEHFPGADPSGAPAHDGAAPAEPCELAQPGGALLLPPKAQGAHPADFADTDALKERIMLQCRYNDDPQPARWNYTRRDLSAHVRRLKAKGWLPAKPLTND